MNYVYLLLLHLAAAIGVFVFLRLKAPAAPLVGAMVGVIALYLLVDVSISYPPVLRILVQVLSGLVIGMRFSASDVAVLKRMLAPVLLLIALVVTINIGFSFIMFSATDLSYITSLFATGLGGVSDLAIIAPEFGADMEQVAILQLSRMVSVIILFPPIITRMIARQNRRAGVVEPPTSPNKERYGWGMDFWLTLACATAGGVLFTLLRVPAGGILGAIIATALWNILTGRGETPFMMKDFAQGMAGAYIGSGLTLATILQLQTLFIPYLVMLIEIFVTAYVGAFLFRKIFKYDWPTALICSAPGGVQVMGLISADLGLEPPKIVLLHTVRIITALMTLPLFGTIVLRYVGL